jgi:hypothetical protein
MAKLKNQTNIRKRKNKDGFAIYIKALNPTTSFVMPFAAFFG